MDLGVLEGQTKGGYFSDYIFDPSVNLCTVQAYNSTDYHECIYLSTIEFRKSYTTLIHGGVKN